MSKKNLAFQADTFGNSNLYKLFRINNQCHENHITTTLLALKLLVVLPPRLNLHLKVFVPKKKKEMGGWVLLLLQ
jgi:hypothetical protein